MLKVEHSIIARTQEIGDIETRRAWVTDRLEIPLTLGELARIHGFSRSQDKQMVKQGDNVAPRLMDCEDDGPVVVARKGYKAVNDVMRVEGIQTLVNM